mgnify:CR=1 FL=1
MAEIRSTMDMVMERAAKMAANADEKALADTDEKIGMKLAATFLSEQGTSLLAEIGKHNEEKRGEILSGILNIFLRNITLPREGSISEPSLKSLLGIEELAGQGHPLTSMCSEIKQILEQYGQHLQQVEQQVDDALRSQLASQVAAQGHQVDIEQINPKQHPQYKEEMSNALSDLNGQYNSALDQRKDVIRQQLLKK